MKTLELPCPSRCGKKRTPRPGELPGSSCQRSTMAGSLALFAHAGVTENIVTVSNSVWRIHWAQLKGSYCLRRGQTLTSEQNKLKNDSTATSFITTLPAHNNGTPGYLSLGPIEQYLMFCDVSACTAHWAMGPKLRYPTVMLSRVCTIAQNNADQH